MAKQRNPDDPYRATDPYLANTPYRANLSEEEIRRQNRLDGLDNELQADPELAEGPAGGTKVAMFALAVAVVLGAVFYGLNNSTINHAGTSSTAQNTAQSSPPSAPPGMRDVTPRANSEPGTTTGAAPARPQTMPPASANPVAGEPPAK